MNNTSLNTFGGNSNPSYLPSPLGAYYSSLSQPQKNFTNRSLQSPVSTQSSTTHLSGQKNKREDYVSNVKDFISKDIKVSGQGNGQYNPLKESSSQFPENVLQTSSSASSLGQYHFALPQYSNGLKSDKKQQQQTLNSLLNASPHINNMNYHEIQQPSNGIQALNQSNRYQQLTNVNSKSNDPPSISNLNQFLKNKGFSQAVNKDFKNPLNYAYSSTQLPSQGNNFAGDQGKTCQTSYETHSLAPSDLLSTAYIKTFTTSSQAEVIKSTPTSSDKAPQYGEIIPNLSKNNSYYKEDLINKYSNYPALSYQEQNPQIQQNDSQKTVQLVNDQQYYNQPKLNLEGGGQRQPTNGQQPSSTAGYYHYQSLPSLINVNGQPQQQSQQQQQQQQLQQQQQQQQQSSSLQQPQINYQSNSKERNNNNNLNNNNQNNGMSNLNLNYIRTERTVSNQYNPVYDTIPISSMPNEYSIGLHITQQKYNQPISQQKNLLLPKAPLPKDNQGYSSREHSPQHQQSQTKMALKYQSLDQNSFSKMFSQLPPNNSNPTSNSTSPINNIATASSITNTESQNSKLLGKSATPSSPPPRVPPLLQPSHKMKSQNANPNFSLKGLPLWKPPQTATQEKQIDNYQPYLNNLKNSQHGRNSSSGTLLTFNSQKAIGQINQYQPTGQLNNYISIPQEPNSLTQQSNNIIGKMEGNQLLESPRTPNQIINPSLGNYSNQQSFDTLYKLPPQLQQNASSPQLLEQKNYQDVQFLNRKNSVASIGGIENEFPNENEPIFSEKNNSNLTPSYEVSPNQIGVQKIPSLVVQPNYLSNHVKSTSETKEVYQLYKQVMQQGTPPKISLVSFPNEHFNINEVKGQDQEKFDFLSGRDMQLPFMSSPEKKQSSPPQITSPSKVQYSIPKGYGQSNTPNYQYLPSNYQNNQQQHTQNQQSPITQSPSKLLQNQPSLNSNINPLMITGQQKQKILEKQQSSPQQKVQATPIFSNNNHLSNIKGIAVKSDQSNPYPRTRSSKSAIDSASTKTSNQLVSFSQEQQKQNKSLSPDKSNNSNYKQKIYQDILNQRKSKQSSFHNSNTQTEKAFQQASSLNNKIISDLILPQSYQSNLPSQQYQQDQNIRRKTASEMLPAINLDVVNRNKLENEDSYYGDSRAMTFSKISGNSSGSRSGQNSPVFSTSQAKITSPTSTKNKFQFSINQDSSRLPKSEEDKDNLNKALKMSFGGENSPTSNLI